LALQEFVALTLTAEPDIQTGGEGNIDEQDINASEEVSQPENTSAIEHVDWIYIKKQIDNYRATIAADKKEFKYVLKSFNYLISNSYNNTDVRFSSPLYYYIIDYSGQHISVEKLFRSNFSSMRRIVKRFVNFNIEGLSKEDGEFLDELLKVNVIDSHIVIGIMTLSEKSILICNLYYY